MNLLRPFFLSITALISPVALANTPPPVTPSLAGSIGQMLFGLGVVIILLIASLWLIKRLSAPRGNAAILKIRDSVAVGPKERVVLIELGPQILVLGVAPGNVRILHTLEADALPTPTTVASEPAGAQFATWLKNALERQKND